MKIPEEPKEPQDLRTRTVDFALRIIQVYDSLPKSTKGEIIGKQILRSGTSVGAQYREGCRAKSDPDIINKFEGALQELDETAYWLDVIVRSGMMSENRLQPLMKETDELISILVTIVTKIKRRKK